MNSSEIYTNLGPSVGHLVFTRDDERVSSGSGFMCGGLFVTCAHVVDAARELPLKVIFPNAIGEQTKEWAIPDGINSLCIRGYSAENSYDYAIIEPPAGIVAGSSLHFAENEPQVGTEVCGLGFPFEQEDLTITRGIVSAATTSGVARMLKLDMSVNPSNSGGPLIDMETGKVVGLIARKSTGLTKAFDEMMRSFDQNLEALAGAQGVPLNGIDPLDLFRTTQCQMKAASQQVHRSAQVGIGWAVYVDPLRSENAFD
jgi:S1-C subfamily serine protease